MKETPNELTEPAKLIDEFLDRVMEHVDSVQVFINKKATDGEDGTRFISKGRGNWFARYGHVKNWTIREEHGTRMDMENEDDEK